MSPLTVRRYRAERLLRQEFEALRGRVLAAVRGRLRASGVSLDPLDLEACYAHAWQGLYAAVLDGQEIVNPAGWLVLVTFRRAIEEHRARGRVGAAQTGAEPTAEGAQERDLAAELDERARLRQLFEGLRGRLSAREREAAVLCYLQGLSRAEAATRMGVSEARMRKLMEGPGCGRPGVAGKVGALVETIRGGGWCEEQGSLMRGLAYGILDPDGERYQLALMHSSECPACRAYVVSLRGLAVTLPPVLLPWGLGAGALALAGEGAQVGRGIGGAVSGSGAAGAAGVAGAGGAAGGGWLLTGGPLGAKLAVGCLLALGVGAGCVALEADPGRARTPHDRHDFARLVRTRASGAPAAAFAGSASGASVSATAGVGARPSSTAALTPLGKASREFGPEQAAAPGEGRSQASLAAHSPTARSASVHSVTATSAPPSAEGAAAGAAPARAAGQPASQSPTRATSGGASAAEREFAPG
jgi:RNA polymerase sigma factor (sigma-70 family)